MKACDVNKGKVLRHHPASEHGFTRIDMVAVAAVVLILGLTVIGTVARSADNGERVTCQNNLRLLGRAVHLWAKDHNGRVPWRTPKSEGGTAETRYSEAWYEWVSLTNELETPRVLSCPADNQLVAADFSRDPGGFLNFAYRGNALSYVVGLDATAAGFNVLIGIESSPHHLLSGDRHLRVDSRNGQCSSGVRNASTLLPGLPSPLWWTNAVHGRVGNLLLTDGRVVFGSSRTAERMFDLGDHNSVVHLLIP